MKSDLRLDRNRDFLFLIISSFIFFLLRLPSLFEPHWYGDEGIYQVIGSVINNGGILYRDIWDNKPPLLYLLYAIFNSDQFTVRLVSLILGLLSVLVFFLLAKKLFPSKEGSNKIHFITTSIFALLFALPLIEGNIANAENFMLLPILISALLIFNKTQTKSISRFHFPFSIFHFPFFTAGLLLGIAFLFKAVAIFDFLAFLSFLIIINLPRRLKPSILKKKEHLLVIVGFFAPVVVTVFYFWTQGAFADLLRATFTSNIDYVVWQNKLILPLGLLIFKTTLLIITIIVILRKRKTLSLATIFILLWFVFSLYNAFFTQRPYAHYLIMLLPSFTLMIGLILWEKKYQKAITLVFILAFVLVVANFNLYRKTVAYYQNFTSFVTGGKSVVDYRGFFDKRTPIDYEIATFLKGKMRDKDSIFIWGDNAQLYEMIEVTPPSKYIVSYHIMGSKDGVDNTRYVLEKTKPRFIIIMPDQRPFPFQLIRYFEKINIDRVLIYESFL